MERLSDKEKFARLKLTRCESIGTRLFWRLIKKYSSAEDVLRFLKSHSEKYKIPEDRVILKEIENTKKAEANFLFFEDDLYPPLLREIGDDAPPIISFLGCKNTLEKFNQQNLISIVGARNSSIMANKLCKRIAEDLGVNDVVVVSGLARGIDSEAHMAGLKTGTIAVLASGIDVVYPKENRKLYDEIKGKGIILAEMPFGTAPQAHLFPKRNRIIAGISSGTVVIEAARQSGSLITARFALDYNRDVFAVPGFPSDLKSEGGNNLLKQGAILTLSAQDILDHLFPKKVFQEQFRFSDARNDVEFETSEINKKILNSLSFVPITIDELISSIRLSPREVLAALLELEFENKIVRLSGQRVCLLSN